MNEHLSVMRLKKSSYDVRFIFRINTKQVASNVALRRQVFESKASADSSWRCSTDDKYREALSSETSSMSADPTIMKDEMSSTVEKLNATMKKERPKPVRENSYLTAVRSSPDAAPVVLRQKANQTNQRIPSEEDNRKTRRTSYLKATAHDEFPVIISSDTEQLSGVATTLDEEDSQQTKRYVDDLNGDEFDRKQSFAPQNTINSSYSRWTAPKFSVDIQFLRRIFEDPQTLLVTTPSIMSSENISHMTRFMKLDDRIFSV